MMSALELLQRACLPAAVARRARVLVLLAGATMLPASLVAQNVERVDLRGNDIAVYNLVGSLNVTGGRSMSATITRRGRDAGRLRVETGSTRGRESLRILYPGDRISVPDGGRRGSRTELRVADDGTFGNDDRRDRSLIRSFGFTGGRRVRIGETGGLEAAADIELQVPDGVTLRLHLAVGDVVIRNVNGDVGVNAPAATVTVSDVKGPLTVDAGSGSATVTNVTGAITLDTGSGQLVARNLSGNALTVDSGSGSVTIDGCSAEKISIDTGSGELRVTGLRTRTLALDSGSGDVYVGLVSGIDVLTIDSGSGDVTLTLPADFAASLAIDTGSGSITSDFPMQVASKSRDALNARIGTGGGRVVVETGSGSVRLRKAN